MYVAKMTVRYVIIKVPSNSWSVPIQIGRRKENEVVDTTRSWAKAVVEQYMPTE